MGHEVLWVIRECQSELLLARTLLSARHQDLAELLKQVKQVLQLPIAGVISDGQQSIRQAVKTRSRSRFVSFSLFARSSKRNLRGRPSR